jgi:hypothetical protein
MKPPFEAICIDAGWGFEKGKTYTVHWVMREGRDHHRERSGYCFKDQWGHVDSTIMDADDFIPTLYLNEKNEDEWRVGPEQEWEQAPDEDKEPEYIEAAIDAEYTEIRNQILNEQGLSEGE